MNFDPAPVNDALMTMDHKILFKKFVHFIEIEISSLCNRKCVYCPQKNIHRMRSLFPTDIYQKAMDDLRSIEYDGTLTFHQYNEPLLEVEHLLKLVLISKKYLPMAKLKLFTNGDKLHRNLLLALFKAGISDIVISCHLNSNEIWNTALAGQKVASMCKRLELPSNLVFTESVVSAYQKNDNLTITIRCTDFSSVGSSRLGTVQTSKKIEHTSVCDQMLHFLNIAYTGNGYICCDICEDTPGIEKYTIGTLHNSNIFDLYKNKIYFIKKYLFETMPTCCQNCSWW